MKDREYWKKRFGLLEQSQNQKGIQCHADIERQYRQAQQQIEGQISAWYQRFADNNSITIQEARRMLSGKELEELKWDINEYIRHGEENAISGTWARQLENASARYHISRLEALKLQTQQSIEAMFGKQLGSIDSAMRDIYKSGYYRTAFEIQKGIGVGWGFATLDGRAISKAISKPWAADGKNFSERVWGNRQKLVNELHTELARNIILGQDPRKAIDAIAKKMDASKNVAGRLVMTEKAFFSSAAQKDCFNELDVELFEVMATLDSHTSEICREMDGKVFPMAQWEVGATAPPFHVWCRTTTVPAFGDGFDSIGERAARGKDGKAYYVPASMTYREWEKSFVEGDTAGLAQAPQINDEKIKQANEEFSQILNNSDSTPISDKMILYNGATEYQLNQGLGVPFAYSPEADAIQYNPSSPDYELYDMNFVQAHELSHRMDMIEYHSWEDRKFRQAIENTRQKLYGNVGDVKSWFSSGGKYEDDMALSDIFSALSEGRMNGVLYGGHSAEYWKEDSKNVCLEIFANMASIDVLGRKSKNEFSGILKELYVAYKELVG